MPKSTYAAPTDLLNLLNAGDIAIPSLYTANSNAMLQAFLTQAQQDFEMQCGRAMLAVSQTLSIDENGDYVLALPASLASITSLHLRGSALTVGTDYFLYPQLPPVAGVRPPFEWIRFAVRLGSQAAAGSRQSVVIAGLWGYATQIPDQAWNSILAGGACLALAAIAANVDHGKAEERRGEALDMYSRGKDAGPYSFQHGLWLGQFVSGIANFSRYGMPVNRSGGEKE